MKFKRMLMIGIITISLLGSIGIGYATSFLGTDKATYNINFKTQAIGNYALEVIATELPSKLMLPTYSGNNKELYYNKALKMINEELDNTAPDAWYDSRIVTKVDVVFAVGQYSQTDSLGSYINSFKRDLGSSSNQIDARVESIKTEGVNLQEGFDWITDVDSTIGDITIQDGGQTVAMVGNPSEPGKNAMWIVTEKTILKQVMTFDYTLDYGDSFSAAGVLLNVGDFGSYVEGYAITFNNCGGTFGGSDYGTNYGASIYKVVYNKGTNSDQFGSECVSKLTDLEINKSGTLEVEMSQKKIKVSGGGLSSPVEVILTKHYGYGLGFFSEHYSHGCSSIGSFDIKNIKLKITEGKSLGQALQDVEWRDNAIRVVIHITDVVPMEYDPENDSRESDRIYTVTKLLNSNAHLINLGNYINDDYLNDLLDIIQQADRTTKGTFIYNSNLNNSLIQSKNYILNLLNGLPISEKWILVDTEVLWNTGYVDDTYDLPLNYGEHDGNHKQPHDKLDKELGNELGIGLTHFYENTYDSNGIKQAKLLAEKWKYRHFNYFFDNSAVQESYHNVWIENPIEVFNHPGKYRINYKRKDNPFYENSDISFAFDNYRYWSTHYDYKVVGT